MKEIKLTNRILVVLKEHEMRCICGGTSEKKSCECGCLYANKGGSTSADNGSANTKEGKKSPKSKSEPKVDDKFPRTDSEIHCFWGRPF